MKNLLFAKGLKTKEEYFKLVCSHLIQGEVNKGIQLFMDMPKPYRRECTVFSLGWRNTTATHTTFLINNL